jgi:predicted small metal-binding protein
MEFIDSIISWRYWDAILSMLVIIHLISEYGHYAWEFISGRKEAEILEDIQNHRKLSTKTQKLKQIQKDIDLIKKRLDI